MRRHSVNTVETIFVQAFSCPVSTLKLRQNKYLVDKVIDKGTPQSYGMFERTNDARITQIT